MQEDRVYDNLLNLPLFLGMSRNDLLEVAGHTKFDFQKTEEGLTIAKEGEPCKRLYFLFIIPLLGGIAKRSKYVILY